MKPLGARAYKAIPGKHYRTPKEVWGFTTPRGRKGPVTTAREFLKANADLLGISLVIPRLRLKKVIESVGAWHVIFQQRHQNLRVHRAYVTVHVDRRRRVYLVKNRAVPRELLPGRPEFRIAATSARKRALRSVSATTPAARVTEIERLWFPAKKLLHPAYKIRVHKETPRSEWIVYVSGETGTVLSKYDNLAVAKGSAEIFNPNPVVTATDWNPLTKKGRPARPPDHAYRTVRLEDLDGNGLLDGRRVSTCLTSRRVKRRDHRFDARSTQPGFDEAMVYFHLNEVMRYLESLGYRGRRAIFRSRIEVDAHGTRDDNSWYSPGKKSLTFGVGQVDDAEDAEIIVHEFGHALQDAICSDFGQSPEAAAMGEGFGDYLAASVFASKKPERFLTSVGSWDAVANTEYEPPCLRRVNEPLTYESFDHSPNADEHENGKIWSAALWEIWRALGRKVADALIIESHFQLDGFTTLARGARAILDADRNLYRGRHASRLRRIFRRRGIGPVE